MFERLEDIKKRYEYITNELTKPEVISDVTKTTKLSKEQSDLSEIIDCYNEYLKVKKDYEDAKELSKDPEMAEFAFEEEEKDLAKQKELEKKLEILLLPKDPNDGKNIIVEIRGAAGGDEANIFAGDLYNMYVKYAENQGFTIENLGSTPGSSGGYSEISFMVKGKNVYSKLKYESGAHRVQRVPATESQGRVHTSTATVLVMPEVDDVDFEIDMNDVPLIVKVANAEDHLKAASEAYKIGSPFELKSLMLMMLTTVGWEKAFEVLSFSERAFVDPENPEFQQEFHEFLMNELEVEK